MTVPTTGLRILMLAPEPFFEARGTPFSEYHRIKALGDLGHRVDLVTYPFGRDVALPNLRIFRSIKPPFIRHVPIGPSLTKLLLDALLTLTAVRRARCERYDAVHSHEEAGLLGVWLARWLGVPHLYDMHSSLPQQLANFGYSRSRLLRRLFDWAERAMVARSRVVITVCLELQDAVALMGAGERAVLIENVMGGDMDESPAASHPDVRATWDVGADQPLVLYTGTFESYQGLDLLIDAAGALRQTHPQAKVVAVGGDPAQVEHARRRAAARGAAMIFPGQQAAAEIPWFVRAADILVSPRVSGTNTPLKIYSYLRSGKPIVATNLRTHTQVLDDTIAVLVPPEAHALAAAIGRLIDRPGEGARLAARAAERAASRYSRDAFVARTREAYARLMNGRSGDRPAPMTDASARDVRAEEWSPARATKDPQPP